MAWFVRVSTLSAGPIDCQFGAAVLVRRGALQAAAINDDDACYVIITALELIFAYPPPLRPLRPESLIATI